jgi:peroxiredoxin
MSGHLPWIRFVLFALISLVSGPIFALGVPDSLQELLPSRTVRDEPFQLASEARYHVFIFLGVECPVARQYGAKLQPLSERFQDRGVQFIGVNSNPQDPSGKVAEFQRDLSIEFPMLKDSPQSIAKYFSATRTAEAVVVDASGAIQYRGRIDDQYSPGVTRGEVTSHDLRDALESLVNGLPVAVPETTPVGCLITFLKPPVEEPTVTFTGQVAKILWDHCYECHRPGEIGPFDISVYDELVGWGEMLVEVMEQKRMPPWHASPEYGSFKNERHLPEGAIDLIRQWIDQGMPYGDESELPPKPETIAGWRLPNPPDLIVEMRNRPYRVPADETVDYQYFVVDPGFTEDRWVSASQIIPGAPSVVHHSIVFVRPPDGGEFVGIGWLNAFVPGQIPVTYPPGYARKIPAGSKLVFQMHYTPSGTEELDKTIIGLNFVEEDQVTHQIYTLIAIDQDFEIPPHSSSHVVAADMLGFPGHGELLAVSPHMHLRGKSFEVFAKRGGLRETILKVPHYDFNWQHTYEYREPIALTAIDGISIAATFDNSESNPFNPNPEEFVMWGDQTWEEMALGYFDVAVPYDASSSPGMRTTYRRGSSAGAPDGRGPSIPRSGDQREPSPTQDQLAEDFADDFLQRYDSNKDGVVTVKEVTTIFRDYGFQIVDTDRDRRITREELIQAARGRRENRN